MTEKMMQFSRRKMIGAMGAVGAAMLLGTRGASGGSVLEAVYAGQTAVTTGFTYADVQDALDAAQGKTLVFQPGTYDLSGGTPIIRSNTRLVADGEVVIVQPNPGKVAGFAIEPGSRDIIIEGFDIRGPWYGTGVPDWPDGNQSAAIWNASYAENIGIDVRGRWYQRQVLGLSAAQMGELTDVSERIAIRDCRIEGFGQSGILADQVTGFEAANNRIRRCGRDGIRLYGVVDGQCAGNAIAELSPGYDGAKPNYNVYGISATRVYGSSAVPDPNLTIGRPSRDIDICFNRIEGAWTWKSLDTHGGVHIRFIGNTAKDSHIGIGIDKGGYSDIHGTAPARGIVCQGNTLISGEDAPYRRAGIAAYGHDGTAAQIGRDLVISGNHIEGYGGNATDGAVSLSNFEAVSIVGNVFRNALRAALTVAQTVRDFSFTGNIADNVRVTSLNVAYGVIVQTTKASGSIVGNTFRNIDQPFMSAGISIQSPEPGFGVKVGADNQFFGAINVQVSSIASEAGGTFFMTPKAFANVNVSASGASLSAGKGIASVTRNGLGETVLTLSVPLAAAGTVVPQVASKGAAPVICQIASASSTGFTVRTFDLAGNPVDVGFYISVLGY